MVMSSPLFLPVLALLGGILLGVAFATVWGRAGRVAERQAAAEHAGRAEELTQLRAEYQALGVQRESLRAAVEELRVAQARLETELCSAQARQAAVEQRRPAERRTMHRSLSFCSASVSEAQAAVRGETRLGLGAERGGSGGAWAALERKRGGGEAGAADRGAGGAGEPVQDGGGGDLRGEVEAVWGAEL